MPNVSLRPDDLVLFQGDSITNAFRMPNEVNDLFQLGAGYAAMAAARLRHDRPNDRLAFINRGVSGNTTRDLTARWRPDCLDLRPTVLSLLIGINDSNAHANGTDDHAPDHYKKRLRRLLQATADHLPETRIILLEPFLLSSDGQRESQTDDLTERQEIVRELATACGAQFVPLQKRFEHASDLTADPAYWIYDTIHPTAAGHRLIADAWLEAVGHPA